MSDEILIDRVEAARRLGLSLRGFERFVQPRIPLVRLGRKRLVRVRTLEQWAARAERSTLEKR